MGTGIKKQTTVKKVGVVACLAGGVVAWTMVHWTLGLVLIVCGIVMGVGLFKFMAGNGQRF